MELVQRGERDILGQLQFTWLDAVAQMELP